MFRRAGRKFFSKQVGTFRSFHMSLHVFWEFFSGFLFIDGFGKAVSFFGSAREVLSEKYYTDCEELAARLSKKGFAVITGGGGGIMRSANKGAKRVGGDSVGINIRLPEEQILNTFLTHSRTFSYFFSRKTILSCASEVYIFFPGGYGTLDELFEMLTLVQTGHSETETLPILLYGETFWKPLVSFIETSLAERYKTISPKDRKLFTVVDSVDEAERYIDLLSTRRQMRVCRIGSRF